MSSADPPGTSPPERFDGFNVLGPLGRGGMGQVYLAFEEGLERRVAIKLVADELKHPDALRRFQREARALARVEHPNVVRIYRLGMVEGRPYIAYELIEGESLERLVAGRDAWRAALHAGRGLAEGLAAVHRAGVLHRDLKPSNVMVTSEGVVKLLDFGLATFSERDSRAPIDAPTPERVETPADELTLTLPLRPSGAPSDPHAATSVLMGTPRYMAPELWDGARASVASDIYALGLVLYELTGVALERNGANGRPPSLRDVHDHVPLELARVVDRCLAEEPTARFESAAEVARALVEIPVAPRASAALPVVSLPDGGDTPSSPLASRTPSDPPDDGSAQRGADNVVRACLRVQRDEAVAVLSWRALSEARLLENALERAGARVMLTELETDSQLEQALAADRSMLVARHGLPPALSMAVLDAVMRKQIPHLHLTRTERRLFQQSYRADPEIIAEVNGRLSLALSRARAVRVTGPSGTSLRILLSPRFPLLCSDGRPDAGRPDNLPSGFLTWHPASVEGVYVADRQLLGMVRLGRDRVSRAPVRFSFADGRVSGVECDDEEVLARVHGYLESHPNASRVGLVSLPSNYVVRVESGMEVQDALLPGLTVGLGFSNPEHSRAPAACPVQLRLFARRLDVQVEGGPRLVTGGRLGNEWVRGIDPFR